MQCATCTMNDINPFMSRIRQMAHRAKQNMRNPSPFSEEDLIQEGIMVFIKDAWPHHIKPGQPGYRANFSSYLNTCLRNHFVDLSHKSFREVGVLATEDAAGYEMISQRREVMINEVTHNHMPIGDVMDNELLSRVVDRLTPMEFDYLVGILQAESKIKGDRSFSRQASRKRVRTEMKIGRNIENRLIASIQKKLSEITGR